MKKNIRIFLFALLAIVVCSCNEKGSAIKDLRSFTSDLAENYENYDVKDWLKAEKKYNKIIDRLDKCKDELTEDEKEQIVELNEKCAEYYTLGMAIVAKKGVEKAGEIMESVGDVVNTAGRIANGIDESNDALNDFLGGGDDE